MIFVCNLSFLAYHFINFNKMNREAASSEKLSSGETAYGETKYLWMNVKVLSIIVGCMF